MVRSVLLVALLLLTGCTVQPVSAPPPAAGPPSTDARAASEPAEPEDPKTSCIPAELISEASGKPTPGPMGAKSPLDLVRCTYNGGTTKLSRIEFTTESDEESFAQRRDEFVREVGADRFRDKPEFFDEAYETLENCCESNYQTVIAARQGSIEVWVSWTLPIAEDLQWQDFLADLFGKIFERLG